MDKEELKEIRKQALDRFMNSTTLENLLFISELLELESDKLKEEKQDKISFDLMNLSFKVAKLINEVF